MLDADGVINACEGGGRQMVQYQEGRETVVVCSHFEGRTHEQPQ